MRFRSNPGGKIHVHGVGEEIGVGGGLGGGTNENAAVAWLGSDAVCDHVEISGHANQWRQGIEPIFGAVDLRQHLDALAASWDDFGVVVQVNRECKVPLV